MRGATNTKTTVMHTCGDDAVEFRLETPRNCGIMRARWYSITQEPLLVVSLPTMNSLSHLVHRPPPPQILRPSHFMLWIRRVSIYVKKNQKYIYTLIYTYYIRNPPSKGLCFFPSPIFGLVMVTPATPSQPPNRCIRPDREVTLRMAWLESAVQGLNGYSVFGPERLEEDRIPAI